MFAKFVKNIKSIDWNSKFKKLWNHKYGLHNLTFLNPWMVIHEVGHWIASKIVKCPIKFKKVFSIYKEYKLINFNWDFVGDQCILKNKRIVKSAGFCFEFVFGSLLMFLLFNNIIAWIYILIAGIHFMTYFHKSDKYYSDFTD